MQDSSICQAEGKLCPMFRLTANRVMTSENPVPSPLIISPHTQRGIWLNRQSSIISHVGLSNIPCCEQLYFLHMKIKPGALVSFCKSAVGLKYWHQEGSVCKTKQEAGRACFPWRMRKEDAVTGTPWTLSFQRCAEPRDTPSGSQKTDN